MPLIDLKRVSLYYEEAGSGSAVLLAHGGGGDASQWRHQISPLAERHRVIAFDARGHGRSSTPGEPWNISDFAEDMAALLRRLDISHAHIVGATLGGVAALEFALAHPRMARSLVLISTAPDTNDEMRARFDASATLVETGDLATFAEGFINFIFSTDYAFEHREEMEDFRERLKSIDPSGYARSIRALGHRPNLSPRLANVMIPVLVLTGAQDPIPTSVPGAELLARSLPNASTEIIAGAAHLPHIEKPQEFNCMVLDFFSNAERERA